MKEPQFSMMRKTKARLLFVCVPQMTVSTRRYDGRDHSGPKTFFFSSSTGFEASSESQLRNDAPAACRTHKATSDVLLDDQDSHEHKLGA